MGRHKYFTVSDFVCQECGEIIPLPRLKAEQRENGHVKDLYCPTCKKMSKFKEVTYKNAIRTMAGEILVNK